MSDNKTNEQEILTNTTSGHFDTGNEEVRNESETNPANDGLNAQPEENETAFIKLKQEMEEWKQKFLYMSAEFENYKKRTLKDRIEFSKMANSEIMSALLPVLDDFERSVRAFEKVQNNAALEGVVLIQHKLRSVLEHKGLKPMDSIGQEFDVELHEAITNLPVEDELQKGKVVEELERGYLLNDKILRHAKVAVGA